MNLTRKLFKIVITLTGLIIGSLASINTQMIPTRIQVVSNENVHLVLKDNGNNVSSVNVSGMSLLPIHVDNTGYYFSPTLSMDDLSKTDVRVSENYIFKSVDARLDTQTDNAYLQAELLINGEDKVNKAIRCQLRIGTNYYYLSQDEPICLTDVLLSDTKDTTIKASFYYELEDETCTIENLNNANGSDVELKLYVYVKE